MRSGERVVRMVGEVRELRDARLPLKKREELKAIVRSFAASHSVDELAYLAGAFEDAAQRKAAGRG